jgi:hypothetical protein
MVAAMKIDRRQLIAAALAAGAAPAARAADATWIPFLPGEDGEVWLAVKINGVETRGLFDNGANLLMLTADAADLVHARPVGDTSNAQGWKNRAEYRETPPLPVQLGPYAATVTSWVGGVEGGPPPILLGQSLFNGQVVEFDFAGRRLRILPRARYRPGPGFRLVTVASPGASGRTSDPFRLTPIKLDGHDLHAILDMGSNDPLIVSRPLVERLGLMHGRRSSQALSSDVGGSYAQLVFSCDRLDLAGQTLRDIPVSVFDSTRETVTMGEPLMSRFGLAIDMIGQDVWLKPRRPAVTAPFSKDRTGLKIQPDGEVARVQFVAPGSPAETQGWKVGEKIRLIDGRPAAGVEHLWTSGKPGDVHSLILADGTVRRLALADYY